MTLKQIEKILLDHLADSINIQKSLVENATDLKWVKRAFWTLATAVLGLCGILLKLVLEMRVG